MADRIIPLLIISALLLALDWYIFRALRHLGKKKSAGGNKIFPFIWWGYTFLVIAGVFVSIYLNLQLALRAVVLVVFVLTYVTKICYLPFLFIDDVRRFFIRLKRKNEVPTSNEDTETARERISRSDFILKAGLVVASIPFASLSWGIVSGAYDYQLKRKKLFLKNLPKAFEGLRLAQISDVHSGSFYNKTAVAGGIEMILGEKPDIIFFTGDLVNNLASEMRDYQDLFSKLKAPLGVYSVLGNHDYGEYFFGKKPSAAKAKNLENLKKTHANMGWDLLLNENRKIKVNGEEIAILGVENWGAGQRFPKFGKLDLALQGTEEIGTKLLLSHDPSHWKAHVLNYPDINATFSGHTHGMQFGVRLDEFQWSPVQYIYDEWAGLYRKNDQQLYVNVGYGFLGYPGRVGILPEITIFELERA